MRILYIGQLINPKNKKLYSGSSNAGAEFEWNMVTSISDNDTVKIDVISIAPIASFPKDRRIIFRYNTETIYENVEAYYPGFINLPLIKQLTQVFSAYCTAKKLTRQNTYEHILSYNTYPQVGLPAYWISKRKKIKHTCVVADLPFNDRSKQSIINKISWHIFGGIAWKLLKKTKSFILLNKNICEFIPKDSSFCVVEGGINPDNYHYLRERDCDEQGRKIILYSGALTQYSGIINLCEAVRQLSDREFVLHIYGNGDLADEIKNIAATCSNIKYCGSVSIEEIRKIQANSWLLVNPRVTTDIISKYTFPSKILEYMASGTPVLTTKISGLTQDYIDNLIICEDNSPQNLLPAIKNASTYINLDIMGNGAKVFVFRYKNWHFQVNKIVKFISSTSNNN